MRKCNVLHTQEIGFKIVNAVFCEIRSFVRYSIINSFALYFALYGIFMVNTVMENTILVFKNYLKDKNVT